jgi:glutamate--cysteine ligase
MPVDPLPCGGAACVRCGFTNQGHPKPIAEQDTQEKMSTRQDTAPSQPVGSRDDLVAWIAAGSKPAERWRIGTEHEKFLFHTDTLKPVPYEGNRGVRALMQGLIDRFGWQPISEGGTVIALRRSEGEPGGTVSLEPGGQFELSGEPLADVHQVASETQAHLDQCLQVGAPLGIGFLGVGFAPDWTLAEMPRMPKQRYQVMTDYMPKVGARGLDMMYRTCTVQVNLDFGSEADMVQKFRVALALQPVATAIFACSPFTEGRPNGFLSLRSEIWRHTDAARTGMLPFVFEPGMGFERYADYALDVPMYFVYREGRYIDTAGASFRDFMAGRLAQLPGERPTLDDWSDHLTTLFPEVRMKRFLEMRGADGGRWRRICAVPAFWTGILYDRTALDAAWDLVKSWTAEERQSLRDAVPRTGLGTPFRRAGVLEVARAALAIARAGLVRRAILDGQGHDETRFLEPVEAFLRDGVSPAQEMLTRYRGAWGGSVAPLYMEYAF